jgi:hypothetical protein
LASLVSCRLSPAGIGLLSILFPPEDSALLTVGLPDHVRTLSGFPCSARVRRGRGGCLLYSGAVVSCRPVVRPDRHLPLLSGQPCNPLEHPIGGPVSNEAYEDSVSFTRPASPSPTAPGWNGTGFGFYPGLRTSRSPAMPAKAGAVPRTLDRITPSHHRGSKRRDHSQRATSRRTVRSRSTGRVAPAHYCAEAP